MAGYPTKSIDYIGQRFTTKVTNVIKEAIPDSEFQMPQGYKQVSMAEFYK